MDDDDFADLTAKPLKLNKSKNKHKSENPLPVSTADVGLDLAALAGSSSGSKIIVTQATKAELAFQSKQDKMAEARILKKASKTHKQRVEEFNKHLDSLSEHYDIPKVSWTK